MCLVLFSFTTPRQAIRNAVDLSCVNVKDKYKEMGSFHQYFNGEKTAPYLTIFIGGNHEASNYLQEKYRQRVLCKRQLLTFVCARYHGGWVAPNIYFCGFASVINIGGLRIVGLSGIYKDNDYNRGFNIERFGSFRNFRFCQGITKQCRIRIPI